MKNLSNLLIIILFAGLGLSLTACSGGHDHGPTPEGLNLIVDGEVVATQQGTTITYPGELNHIPLSIGETAVVEVQWFLSGGEPYVYSTDDGYRLRFEITDDSIIGINHPAGDEWSMQLVGESAGEAEFMIQLFHVNHSDFDSRMFRVNVTEE